MARKATYDSEKVKELRMSLTDASLLVMSDEKKDKEIIKKWSTFKKQLILKMAPHVLPRVNEHSGTDGSPISVKIVQYGNHAPASV